MLPIYCMLPVNWHNPKFRVVMAVVTPIMVTNAIWAESIVSFVCCFQISLY